MTVLSFYARNQVELPPTFIEAERIVKAHAASADESCRTSDLYENTGELSDSAREELISVYGRLMQECVEHAEAATSDERFDRSAFWLIEAQGWKERMHALIAKRKEQPSCN